jgi:release factor glutamine methyltransferase
MNAELTVAQVLQLGTAALKSAGIDSAASDARTLICHAMQIAPDRLTLHLQDKLTQPANDLFQLALSARAQRRPVAQIIGRRMFWGRDFWVTKDTLDPRPETEHLVAEALRGSFTDILDLGTGTGCILVSLLAERPAARGVGSDVSGPALAVASRNAMVLGVADRAEFLQSNWFSAVSGQFDLITANPPYISADEMAHLSRDVRDWEPHLALSPGGDGLDAYRSIAAHVGAHLRPNGRLLLEIGPSQGAAVCAMLAEQSLVNIAVLSDFDGRDRVICASMP